MNNDTFWQVVSDYPPVLKILLIATTWAIFCVGVCLPLITLKLYWQNIRELFEEKPRYSPYAGDEKFRTQ
jgi:hypothetical protein